MNSCEATFITDGALNQLYIIPSVKNCFRCALETMGLITWQVILPGSPLPVDIGTMTPFAMVDGNTLIISDPETFVLPGLSGARQIICNGVGQQIALHLISPGIL